MHWRSAILITFLFVFIAGSEAEGQPSNEDLKSIPQFELNGHVGRLVKIHGEYPPNDISSSVEFNLSYKLRGNKSWHRTYSSPSAGFSIIHSQFGNQDVLGQALAVIPAMRFEKWVNSTRWSWRAGLGFAAFNKPYNEFENPRNLVIGSRVTNMSMIRLEMSKPLGQHMRYSLGFSFTHCSDGHIAVPNIGANLIAITAGFSWSQSNALLMASGFGKSKLSSHRRWQAGGSIITGLHEFNGTIRPVNGPRYLVMGENIFATKELRENRFISFGVNHHFYQAYLDYMITQELFTSGENNKWKSHTLVIYGGYEWKYGKMSLFLQAGLNVYAPFLVAMNEVWDLPKHGWLYLHTANKIGYRYYPLSNSLINPFISLGVKTNGGTADFVELAAGFSIHKKRELSAPVAE